MAERRRGLGRGIAALIPDSQRENKDRPIDIFFGRTEDASSSSDSLTSDVSRETSVQETASTDAATESTAPARKAKKAATNAVTSSPEKKRNTKKSSRPTVGEVTREHEKLKPAEESQPDSGISAGHKAEKGVEELVAVPGATYAELPLDSIVPNQKQPRSVFDEDDLEELAHSINEVGVLQPVIVRPLSAPISDSPEARYELIMGERRWRASRLAGAETVPAIVRRTADEDLLRDALLENLHRAQLNPLEEAAAYQQLLDDFSCTQEELSRRIARSRPQISNTLRLLKLPPLVQKRVAAQVLSAGHARALLGLADPAAMERLAQRIVAEGLSVRQVEEIVALGDEPVAAPTQRRKRIPAPEFVELATKLGDRFDTKVTVNMGQRKGSIKIDFASVDDLNRILDVLAPGTGGLSA
ncbi:ParB/RepB/Spo0J family partition protein [Arcanobacterium haemolyticum]|nr:ParB/RepB/Spo0J family partition protein [Arcanobacterium haemolyticum]